jgi:hypothetical protein
LARSSFTRAAQRAPRAPARQGHRAQRRSDARERSPAGREDDAATGMKMRQSLDELEQEFAREASLERYRRAWLQRTAARRKLKRETDRRHKRGTLRFAVLVGTLIATAVVVTVAMFATLYLLLD